MNVGIEIGGTKLQVATGDPSTGKIDQIYRYRVDKALGVEGILGQIEKTLRALPYPATRGRVEDAHMGICHMICYAFIEKA